MINNTNYNIMSTKTPWWIRVPVLFFLIFGLMEFFIDSGDKPAILEYPITQFFMLLVLMILIAIELIFSDSGPGFQGSNLELMFEPGFSMKPDGTGLGLALVGEAVSRLKGTIRATNSENGATFVINFKKG